LKRLRVSVTAAALAGLSVCFGSAAADEAKSAMHHAVAGEAGSSPANQLAVTGTISGDDLLFSQRSGTIVVSAQRGRPAGTQDGTRVAAVEGSFVSLRDPRRGDSGEISVGISSEHGDAAGPALASADGRVLRYSVFVDGVAVRPDGPPVPVGGSADRVETTNYRVSFDVAEPPHWSGDAYHDTVTLSVIP